MPKQISELLWLQEVYVCQFYELQWILEGTAPGLEEHLKIFDYQICMSVRSNKLQQTTVNCV